MKRLVLAALCAVGLMSAEAGKVKVGQLVVADRRTLSRSAQKIVEMSGSIMLGGLLQAALEDCPQVPTAYSVTVDDDLETSLEKVESKSTPKLGKDVVIKMRLSAQGIRNFCKLEKIREEMTEEQRDLVKDYISFKVLVRVNEKGVSTEGVVKVVENARWYAMYPTGAPLKKDALAFAGSDAVCAAAVTQNGGADFSACRQAIEIVEKQGVKLDFLTVTGEKGDCFLKFDPAGLKGFSEQCAALKKLDDNKAVEADLEALKKIKTKPAGLFSLAIKGYSAPFSSEERFQATLPEYADKPLTFKAVFSLYALFKAIAPQLIALTDKNSDAEQVKSVLSVLPAESRGACAVACCWKDPTRLDVIWRVSPDEIRNLGTVMGTAMNLAVLGVFAGEDDDDKDEADDKKGDSDDTEGDGDDVSDED